MTGEGPWFSAEEVRRQGGPALLREAEKARALGASVAERREDGAKVTGQVSFAGTRQFVRADLSNRRFPDFKCGCPQGRQGVFCLHAALLLLPPAELPAPPPPPPKEPLPAPLLAAGAAPRADARAGAPTPAPAEVPSAAAAAPRGLMRSPAKGQPLRVWLLLPPNAAAQAEKDQIPVRLEAEVAGERGPLEALDRSRAYAFSEPTAAALALLEGWGQGKFHTLLRLTRERTRALVGALAHEGTVAWVNAPAEPVAPLALARLAAEALREPPPKPAPPPPPPPRKPSAAEHAAPKKHAAAPDLRARQGRLDLGGPKFGQGDAKAEDFRAPLPIRPGALEVDGSEHYLSIRLPDRQSATYEQGLAFVKEHGFSLDPANRTWWLRDRHRALNLLAQHGRTLREKLGGRFVEGFAQRTTHVRPAKLEARVEEAGGRFAVELRLQAGALASETLLLAVRSGRFYVEEGKQVWLVDPADLAKLNRAQRALSGEPERPEATSFRRVLQNAELADAEALLEDAAGPLVTPEEWKARSGALRSVGALAPAPLDPALDARLRLYQRIGAAWLWHLFGHGLGGVLADEMGLGKTVQALAFLGAARAAHPEPSLVVAPAGLLENWRREAARFLAGAPVVVHHGANRRATPQDFRAGELVLTSYGTLARDAELFAGLRWNVVVADEAQHLKNRRTQHARALRALQARGRFVLTGTPIENSLDDLRSLFAFVLPGYLAKVPEGVRGEDRGWYDRRHRQQAAPYILRRSKSLVAPELPEKIEQVLPIELGPKQAKLYADTLEATRKAIFELEMSGANDGTVQLAALTQLLRLRQVCADPRLLDETFAAEDSAKLAAFEELLDEAEDGGHRLLVFSQFTSVLDLLAARLDELGHRFCRIDGSTPPKARQTEVDRYQNDPEIPVFLISVKAGGTGLNLTAADTVVHFDPWWNPAVEQQATDRAHRLGQTKVVTSYKLIASGTVEERVLALQQSKAQLLRDLLDESAAATAKVSLADLRDLLAG